jgi:hypothetical protein
MQINAVAIGPLIKVEYLLQQRHDHPQLRARFLLVRRRLGDGCRVADAGEAAVFLLVVGWLAVAETSTIPLFP